MPPYLSDRYKPRTRRQRKLPWPASRISRLELSDVRAMADHAGVPVTVFVRRALMLYLVRTHREIWPDLPATPWDRFVEPLADAPVRRVAEGEQ